jgi:hypothetical protein
MKRYVVFFILTLLVSYGLAFAAGPELSGVLESNLNYTAGAGEAQEHSFGFEEYANLRLRQRTGERAIFFAAVNLIALTGNYLQNSLSLPEEPAFASGSGALLEGRNPSSPFVSGQNFAAAMELERLYFRINGDYIDAEAGLLRMNFGYGQVWGSSDFLNPRNPLFPNARPRGVLGMNAAFYPEDSLKLAAFVAAPKNPLQSDGGGFIPGLTLDKHWDRASLQALYAFRTPGSGDSSDSKHGVHRFGLSVKADLELGLVADGLFTVNPGKEEGFNQIDGLSLGAGFDYNFFKGDLYVLAEYLFNGASSSTALGFGGGWSNNHYFYGTALYRFNDYCNLSLSAIFCFDDLSFSPFAALNYDVFQGFSMNLSARLPMDQKTMTGGKAGELGPVPPGPDGSEGVAGARFIVNAGARLRF